MMMAALHVTEVNFVQIAIAFAALAYIVERALDALGWSRSSRTLRQENEDLIRRNQELDREVLRLKAELSRHGGELTALRTQVADLSKHDQAAVLHSIDVHERAAGVRHERTLVVLTEIRDAMKAA